MIHLVIQRIRIEQLLSEGYKREGEDGRQFSHLTSDNLHAMLLLSGTYVKLFKNVTALISPLPLTKILLIYMLQKSRIAFCFMSMYTWF